MCTANKTFPPIDKDSRRYVHTSPTIENWKLELVYGTDKFVITGNVYGNLKFSDGEWIRTSMIQAITFSPGDERAFTLNTVYALGEPA